MLTLIPTRNGQTWCQTFLPEHSPKALVVHADGSGEYRTVQTERVLELADWWNSQGYAYRVFDKYGCGESDGFWSKVTMDLLADQICDLITESRKYFSLPVVLSGQSEGSKLGFEVAARVKVEAFVARVPSHQKIEDRMKYQFVEMNKKPELWSKWEMGIEAAKKTGQAYGFLCDHAVSYWISCLDRLQPGDLIPKIKAPIFVLNGGADPFTPDFAYRPIHEAIEQKKVNERSQAKVYAGVGHSLLKPGCAWKDSEVAADMLGWLNTIV